MNRLTTVVTLAAALFLTGCGPDRAPQDIVDTNMTISRLNAQKNANSYLPTAWPEGTVHPTWNVKATRILMQSDSTITAQCRYGDGWASGDLQFENGKAVKIKCQTNGVGKGINGCMQDQEFQTKAYKNEDGKCANLDKLEKFQ